MLTAKQLGAITWFKIGMDSAIPMEVLKERLTEHGLEKFMPCKRVESDALRLAFARMMTDSEKQYQEGSEESEKVYVTEQLVITPVPKQKGDTVQRWAAHTKIARSNVDPATLAEPDQQTGEVDFQLIGYISLTKDNTLTLPPGVHEGGVDHVSELVDYYIKTADRHKLYGCLSDIMGSLSQIKLDAGSVAVVNSEGADLLRDHVKPVFSNLDKGSVGLSVFTISTDDPENVADLKQDVDRSIGKDLKKMMAAILAAQKNNEGITKGQIADWVAKVEDLYKNMELFNLLGIELPVELPDLEMQLEVLKAEVEDRPKKKRLLSRPIAKKEEEE